MHENIDAVFEDGAFRPTNGADIPIPNGARVRISIEPVDESTTPDVLSLAASVFAGLAPDDIAEVERIATIRSNFFSSET